jgi:hypothetical protein
MTYRHTQTGWFLLYAIGVTAGVLALVAFMARDAEGPVGIILAVTFVVLLIPLTLFRSLTVEVGPSTVDVRFGGGFIRKSIPLDRIRSAQVVRYPWYYGMGIRIIPRGTLWNVDGMRAVELELGSNRRFAIGSDEPEALHAAIEDARRALNG